jgi:hypothetical protein
MTGVKGCETCSSIADTNSITPNAGETDPTYFYEYFGAIMQD